MPGAPLRRIANRPEHTAERADKVRSYELAHKHGALGQAITDALTLRVDPSIREMSDDEFWQYAQRRIAEILDDVDEFPRDPQRGDASTESGMR